MRHLIVTRRPAGPVSDPDDLRSLQVGVIPGTSWEEVVVDAGVPEDQRVAFPDAVALLDGLRDGKVDAVVRGAGRVVFPLSMLLYSRET